MGALDFTSPVLEHAVYTRLSIELDDALANTMWITMNADPAHGVPNFSLPLLHELHEMVQTIKAGASHWHHEGRIVPVHYAVMRSAHPEYFNAGGDLSFFRRCIADQNRQGLYQYAMLCVDILFSWSGYSGGQTNTIALVEGRALGGGFEAVLSADHVIAEDHSTFGFPEIMFGLFPCTGAMSLLSRRVSPQAAERMMTNGKIYSAQELLELGIIDTVCERGTGRGEVERYVASHSRRHAARQAVTRSRKRHSPLDYEELSTVVDDWVHLAMSLGAEQLRVMDMLIMMQEGRGIGRRRLAGE